jgi:hypothetical protein
MVGVKANLRSAFEQKGGFKTAPNVLSFFLFGSCIFYSQGKHSINWTDSSDHWG